MFQKHSGIIIVEIQKWMKIVSPYLDDYCSKFPNLDDYSPFFSIERLMSSIIIQYWMFLNIQYWMIPKSSEIIQCWMILVINLWMILVWVKIHPKLDDSCHRFVDDSCMGSRFIQNWMILVIDLWMILVWGQDSSKTG